MTILSDFSFETDDVAGACITSFNLILFICDTFVYLFLLIHFIYLFSLIYFFEASNSNMKLKQRPGKCRGLEGFIRFLPTNGM